MVVLQYMSLWRAALISVQSNVFKDALQRQNKLHYLSDIFIVVFVIASAEEIPSYTECPEEWWGER